MKLKEKILESLYDHQSDEEVIEELNVIIKNYKRLKNRYTYDLQSNYCNVIRNRKQLSESICMRGWPPSTIYQRLLVIERKGFNIGRENKELTQKICLALKCNREQLIKKFTEL